MGEWNYEELVSSLAKAMGVEMDETDEEDDDDTMHFVGVKSCTMYSGGRKMPNPPSVKINLNGDPGPIHINFDNND